MKPLIRKSGLTDRYYLLTRYRIEGDTVVAFTRHDVTDEVVALLAAEATTSPWVCPECLYTGIPERDHNVHAAHAKEASRG